MEPIDAYELFMSAYDDDDHLLEDVEFNNLIGDTYEFDIKLTKEQKVKVGEYLLRKHEEDLEDYQNYLSKSAHESEEEDWAREHYYEEKYGKGEK